MKRSSLKRITIFAVVGIFLLLSGSPVLTQQALAETDIRQNIQYLDDRGWISTIGTLLYADEDRNSFFSGVSISVDADTAFFNYSVFAAIDIIDPAGRTERLHTTRTFDIYGHNLSDEYHVDIDLLSYFAPAFYDLQITLFDAYNNQVLDQVTALDFRNLSSLPLESADNPGYLTPVSDRPDRPFNDNVLAVEYAGSNGFGFLLMLFICVVIKTVYRILDQKS